VRTLQRTKGVQSSAPPGKEKKKKTVGEVCYPRQNRGRGKKKEKCFTSVEAAGMAGGKRRLDEGNTWRSIVKERKERAKEQGEKRGGSTERAKRKGKKRSPRNDQKNDIKKKNKVDEQGTG